MLLYITTELEFHWEECQPELFIKSMVNRCKIYFSQKGLAKYAWRNPKGMMNF